MQFDFSDIVYRLGCVLIIQTLHTAVSEELVVDKTVDLVSISCDIKCTEWPHFQQFSHVNTEHGLGQASLSLHGVRKGGGFKLYGAV